MWGDDGCVYKLRKKRTSYKNDPQKQGGILSDRRSFQPVRPLRISMNATKKDDRWSVFSPLQQ